MKSCCLFTAITIIAVTVTGCASLTPAQYAWNHETKSREMFDKDVAQCDYETSAATQQTDYGYNTIFGQELDRAVRKRNLTEQCMKAKGYYSQRIN